MHILFQNGQTPMKQSKPQHKIFFAKTMRESTTELALHLWPRYPDEWNSKTIGEVLHYVRGIRNDRIQRMLAERGLLKSTPMNCIHPSDLKWLSDDLLYYRNRKR